MKKLMSSCVAKLSNIKPERILYRTFQQFAGWLKYSSSQHSMVLERDCCLLPFRRFRLCYAKRWVPGSHDSCVWPWNVFFSIKKQQSRTGGAVSKYLRYFQPEKLGVSGSKLTIYNMFFRSVGKKPPTRWDVVRSSKKKSAILEPWQPW